MAGIIVSGGTYSGSGDMTTDYIFVYSGSYIAGEGNTNIILGYFWSQISNHDHFVERSAEHP